MESRGAVTRKYEGRTCGGSSSYHCIRKLINMYIYFSSRKWNFWWWQLKESLNHNIFVSISTHAPPMETCGFGSDSRNESRPLSPCLKSRATSEFARKWALKAGSVLKLSVCHIRPLLLQISKGSPTTAVKKWASEGMQLYLDKLYDWLDLRKKTGKCSLFIFTSL